MTSSQLSPEQREEADKIFKASLRIGGAVGFCAFMGLMIATDYITSRIFHKEINSGVFGGIAILVVLYANWFATRQVRNAGLSLDRVERHLIPKTITTYSGTPFELHSNATRRDAWWGVAVLAVFFVLLIWVQVSQNAFPLPMLALLFCMLAVCLLQVRFRLSNPPLLRLDSHGVFTSAQHFWSRGIPWTDIKEAEFQQFFDYKGNILVRKLIFRKTQQRGFVTVTFVKSRFSEQQVREIVTQIEAIFTSESKISGA